MEQFERIVLWFGDDVRARQAANQFSKKLNIQRCHIVRYLHCIVSSELRDIFFIFLARPAKSFGRVRKGRL